MKKAILIGSLFLCIGLGSCKKCYVCTLQYHATVRGLDSVINLRTELCNTGNEGAGTNLDVAIADIQRNGYVCVQE